MVELLVRIKLLWTFGSLFFLQLLLREHYHPRRRRIPQFIYNESSDEPSAAPLAQLDLSKRGDSKFIQHNSSNIRIAKGRFEFYEQFSWHQSHCTFSKLLSAIVTNLIRKAVGAYSVWYLSKSCSILARSMRRNSLFWGSLSDDDATRKSPTYLCFVDLQKAFDRVPHEALFCNVAILGILGRCLAFHRGLYRISWTQMSSRISQTLSPVFSFCRGVVLVIFQRRCCSVYSSIRSGANT